MLRGTNVSHKGFREALGGTLLDLCVPAGGHF